MTKKFQQELKELAKKHNMDLNFECMYCARRAEQLVLEKDGGLSYMVTFTEMPNKGVDNEPRSK